MKELVIIATISMLLTMIVVGLVVTIAYPLNAKGCENKTESFKNSKYDFFGGCMVEKDGKWLPLSLVRIDY